MLESEVNSISSVQKIDNFYRENSNNSIEQCSHPNFLIASDYERDSTTQNYDTSIFDVILTPEKV